MVDKNIEPLSLILQCRHYITTWNNAWIKDVIVCYTQLRNIISSILRTQIDFCIMKIHLGSQKWQDYISNECLVCTLCIHPLFKWISWFKKGLQVLYWRSPWKEGKTNIFYIISNGLRNLLNEKTKTISNPLKSVCTYLSTRAFKITYYLVAQPIHFSRITWCASTWKKVWWFFVM